MGNIPFYRLPCKLYLEIGSNLNASDLAALVQHAIAVMTLCKICSTTLHSPILLIRGKQCSNGRADVSLSKLPLLMGISAANQASPFFRADVSIIFMKLKQETFGGRQPMWLAYAPFRSSRTHLRALQTQRSSDFDGCEKHRWATSMKHYSLFAKTAFRSQLL